MLPLSWALVCFLQVCTYLVNLYFCHRAQGLVLDFVKLLYNSYKKVLFHWRLFLSSSFLATAKASTVHMRGDGQKFLIIIKIVSLSLKCNKCFNHMKKYELIPKTLVREKGKSPKDTTNCPEKVMKITHFDQTNQRLLSYCPWQLMVSLMYILVPHFPYITHSLCN